MATFGGISCLFLEGNPQGPQVQMKKHQRLGIDGISVEYINREAGETTLEITGQFLTITQANTWLRSLEAKVGSVVSFTLSNDQTFSNFLVMKVQAGEIKKVANSVGGSISGSSAWAKASITVQYIYGVI